MKHKRQKRSSQGSAGCGLILMFLIGFILLRELVRNNTLQKTIIIAVVALVLLVLIIRMYRMYSNKKATKKATERVRVFQITDVDSMNGYEFEHYVARLLNHRGFQARVTPGSGDFGVDIVASKDKVKYAIQVKRHAQKISRRAISDAVTGKQHYRCEKAMVVTNSYFTPDSVELARSTGCELVDRDALMKWVLDFQKAENQAVNTFIPPESF